MQATFLAFLKELAENNDRDWFHANKNRYEAAVKVPFETLVAQILSQIGQKDERFLLVLPKNCIYRIHRDTRFSPDKTPYKTHVSASISPQGTKNKEFPGFYLQLGGDQILLGGGAYFLEKETLKKVRHYIASDLEEFESVMTEENFVKKFGGIKGEANKRLEADFQAVFAQQPLIANKQFYFMSTFEPDILLKNDFASFITEYYLAAEKVIHFLEKAIQN